MPKLLENAEDCIGKMIKQIIEASDGGDDYAVILFTDDTCIFITPGFDYIHENTGLYFGSSGGDISQETLENLLKDNV
jgi:hypothetical protein